LCFTAGKLRNRTSLLTRVLRIPYLLFELAGDEVDGDRELLLLVEWLAEKLGHQPHNPLIHQNFIEPASTHYYLGAVLRIRRIRMLFLRLLDPDPLVRDMDPNLAPDPDPSIINQK
jgi:hypothetical protein